MSTNNGRTEHAKIYVVSWEYGDKSSHGIIRAFDDVNKAEDLLKLLKEHGESRTFFCTEVEIVHDYD